MAYIGRQPVLGEIIRLNSIESSFNGSDTTFNLTRTVSGSTINFYPVSSEQLFVSLGGVIQEPDPTGNTGFKINYNQIVFAVAPAAGTSCFIIAYGNILDVGTPADGTVTPEKLSTGGPYWDTSGNLGLGNLSYGGPSVLLHLRAETGEMLRLQSNNLGLGATSNIRLLGSRNDTLGLSITQYGSTAGGANSARIFNESLGDLRFGTNNEERLRITSTGNVGIGTTDPRSALDVYQGIVHLGTPGVTNGIINSANGIFINLDSDDNSTNDVLIIGKDRTGTTGGTEILRVVETGNVGIGTDDPAQLLHLAGSSSRLRIQNTSTGLAAIELIPGGEVNPYYIYIDSSRNLRIQDHSTERFRITSAGNVGIGTTDSDYKLRVEGTNNLNGASVYETTLSSGAGPWTYTLSVTGLSTGVHKIYVGLNVAASASTFALEYLISGNMNATNDQKAIATISNLTTGAASVGSPVKISGGMSVSISCSAGANSSVYVVVVGSASNVVSATLT